MSACDNCKSDRCDMCGEAQSARERGSDYGDARKERKKNQGSEAAFLDSGDNTM